MTNLDQLRAAAAIKAASNVNRAAVNKLPAMIIQNGLLATAAFCSAAGGGDNRPMMLSAMDALAAHLGDKRLGLASLEGTRAARDLVNRLTQRDCPPGDLQRATTEALAFLSFLKRFAVDKDKKSKSTPEES